MFYFFICLLFVFVTIFLFPYCLRNTTKINEILRFDSCDYLGLFISIIFVFYYWR